MPRGLILFLISISFLFGCNTHSDKASTFSSFPQSKILKGSPLQIHRSLVSPQGIRLIDNKLILLDNLDDTLVHVFDAVNLNHLGSGGRSGKGSGEIIAPWDITNTDNKHFWVHDISLSKLVQFDLDSMIKLKSYNPGKELKLSSDLSLCYFPV